jgi:hypothetical protein
VESGARSHEDEVTAARKDMKSNREKLLRTRLNEHFSELASVLGEWRNVKAFLSMNRTVGIVLTVSGE